MTAACSAILSKANRRQRGQSLVEFTLVLPIFILLLVGSGYVGIAMYQGHMLADAVREPAIHKLDMANQIGPVSAGQLTGYISGAPTTGTLSVGGLVDSVSVVNSSNAAIVVGQKVYNSPVAFIPSFNFSAAQPINLNLLSAANTGGAKVRPTGTPWIPGGPPPSATSSLALPTGTTTVTPAPTPPADPAAVPADPAATPPVAAVPATP